MSDAANRLAQLDDYVSGHMGDGEAAALEEELFGLGHELGGAGAFLDGLSRTLSQMQASNAVFDGGTRAQVDALRAAGARVHFADLGPGGEALTFPSWGPGVDVVVARLGVDLRGEALVDVEIETGDGQPIKTFREVSCDPTDGALYAICEEPLARIAFGGGRTITRVVATRAGRRETVAVYDISPAF